MPGTLFFTAPSMAENPDRTSTTYSVPFDSIYLMLTMSLSLSIARKYDVSDGNGRVCQFDLVYGPSASDQLTTHHEVGRRVDRFDGLHAVTFQMKDGEASGP